MNEAELLAWFRALAKDGATLLAHQRDYAGDQDESRAATWVAEAQAALEQVFPAGHSCRLKWRETFEHIDRSRIIVRNHEAVPATVGIFTAALRILEAHRLESFLDSIRVETVSEVLDQAGWLLPKSPIAAAVLAGGALETHLLHLCVRNNLTPTGEGSISKYDGAIAQARNAGTVVVYGATDSKQIIAWGGIRNDAAHTPTTFGHAADVVQRMAEGVRQFIARVP